MAHSPLPHDHGDHLQAQYLSRQLTNQEEFHAAAELFRQLSDPTRVRLFWLLCHREDCLINLSAMLGMSSPALSHHLRVLKDMNLVESRRDGKEVYYKIQDTAVCQLLHKIVEQVMEIACPPDTSATAQDITRQVHQYLVENIREHITIEELSKQFHINTTTLKQAFKTVYGTSIAAHMTKHRMELAAKLLHSTQDPISSIAQSVGYRSQSRFTDAFKKIYGVLPTDYRKQ